MRGLRNSDRHADLKRSRRLADPLVPLSRLWRGNHLQADPRPEKRWDRLRSESRERIVGGLRAGGRARSYFRLRALASSIRAHDAFSYTLHRRHRIPAGHPLASSGKSLFDCTGGKTSGLRPSGFPSTTRIRTGTCLTPTPRRSGRRPLKTRLSPGSPCFVTSTTCRSAGCSVQRPVEKTGSSNGSPWRARRTVGTLLS